MYYEELDLTLRLRGHGWRILYVPSSFLFHKGSQSVRASSNRPLLFKQGYGNRNRLKILAKYYPVHLLLRNLHLILFSLLYWNTVFLRDGGFRFMQRAVRDQIRFLIRGLHERGNDSSVDARLWLAWMKRQGVREMLEIARSSRGYRP